MYILLNKKNILAMLFDKHNELNSKKIGEFLKNDFS